MSEPWQSECIRSFFERLAQRASNDASDPIIRFDALEFPPVWNDILFSSMAIDFTMELSNLVNLFFINVRYANCWVQASETLPPDRQRTLRYEFAEPHLELAINRPYSIRNLFTLAVTHLVNQSNRYRCREWKDELPADRQITFKTLASLGTQWVRFAPFIETLTQINDVAFVRATNNYRNRNHHSVPLNFGTGLVSEFKRTQTNEGVAYTYVNNPPLKLAPLLLTLEEQHQCCRRCFSAYWELLQEMFPYWKAEPSPSPSAKPGEVLGSDSIE